MAGHPPRQLGRVVMQLPVKQSLRHRWFESISWHAPVVEGIPRVVPDHEVACSNRAGGTHGSWCRGQHGSVLRSRRAFESS
jgi:hypothetical protein